MNEQVRGALSQGNVVDITTTGRRSGTPRRIEIVFHNIGGRLYISGVPRADHTRAWLRNLAADPHLTFHLKGAVAADLPATARIITDVEERRAVLAEVAKTWGRQDLETMVRHSPLIEVTLEDRAA
jgi:deazaflavin-dependent oxidoreductase (nitroreductase family)